MAAPNMLQVANINGEVSVITTLDTSAKTILFNEASSGKVIKLNQIVVTNVDGTNSADVTIQLSRAGTRYSIVSTVAVPADSSLVVLSKEIGIYLEEEDAIVGFASAAGDLEVSCSYEVIAESENIVTTRGLQLYYDPGDDNSIMSNLSFGDVVNDTRTSGTSKVLSATAESGASLYLAFRSHDGTESAGVDGNYTVGYSNSGFNGTSYVEFSYNSGTDNIYTQTTSDSTLSAVMSLIPVYNANYISNSVSAINSKTPPAVSCNVGDILLVAIYHQDINPAPTISPPSGYTLLVDNGVSTGTGAAAGVALAYKEITSTGTETPGDWTINNANLSDVHLSQSVLIRYSPNIIKDLTSNAYNGTLTDVTYLSQNGGVLDFDVTATAVCDTQADILDLGANDFTWEVWVNTDAHSASSQTIIEKGEASGDRGYVLYIDAFNDIDRPTFAYSFDGTNRTFFGLWNATDPGPMIEGDWYHVAVIRSGGTLTGYRNGVAENSRSDLGTNAIYNSTEFLQFGAWNNFNWLDGKLGPIRFYDRALSATEISRNYNAQKGRFGL